MSSTNPYTLQHLVSAADAPVTERLAFLQRTYGLLLAGILCFAGTLWAAGNVESVSNLAAALWGTNRWLVIVLILGGSWAVHSLADKYPINLVAYFTYAFMFGLLLAPIVLYAAHSQPMVLAQASILTTFVFVGLTAYVFFTRKDFSFLGGALSIGLFAMIGIAIAGMIGGFQMGLWYSLFGVVLFSGYVLYDTSKVLHHYPTNRHVSAAIVLFVDVVLLFKYILMMFLRSRD